MRGIKPILYVFIPLLCAATVGMCFGYFKYFEELKYGSDEVDAYRWAFIDGLFRSVYGLGAGLMIDLLMWLFTDSPRMKIK